MQTPKNVLMKPTRILHINAIPHVAREMEIIYHESKFYVSTWTDLLIAHDRNFKPYKHVFDYVEDHPHDLFAYYNDHNIQKIILEHYLPPITQEIFLDTVSAVLNNQKIKPKTTVITHVLVDDQKYGFVDENTTL